MPTPAADRGGAASEEAEAEAGGARRRCVSCGARVGALFVQYSPGNIRLMKCDTCKAVADPYIECEFMIILIDLILHKERAYRHLLFNMLNLESGDITGILQRSCLIYILLDACILGCSFLLFFGVPWYHQFFQKTHTLSTLFKVLNNFSQDFFLKKQ